MKVIKTIFPAIALTLLASGTVYTSNAHAYGCPCGGGHGGGHGSHMAEHSNITDAQRQEARKLVEQSQSKMAPLKQQLFIKHEELKALQNAATPDVKAVAQKATEITELQQKLATERNNLGQAIDKALGLEPGTHNLGHKKGMGHGIGKGHGAGKGMNSMGHGMGHQNN